ncbi:MAG: hypothetical protein G01um101413_4 [Parcubacteria group bacterium Gr01-1014_13]|nr:MAG: hypothetical protein G01um101413_4 [Parcubacteria group bacterium Gr01-1014_13]
MRNLNKILTVLVFVSVLGACPGRKGGGSICPNNPGQNNIANGGGGGGGGQDSQKCTQR